MKNILQKMIILLITILVVSMASTILQLRRDNKPCYDLNQDKKVDIQDISILMSKMDK